MLSAQVNKAVLVVDLVESVRLMAQDEIGVVIKWQGFLRFAHQTIGANTGRLVKHLGDGLLAEFDQCGDAVMTAHQLHRYFDAYNATVPADLHMLLRAGINATHLYADEHDVYGHGVNLAARVTSLAPPGGTAVTASVRDALVDGLHGRIEDRGESVLKHWPGPVRTWCVWPCADGRTGLPANTPMSRAEAGALSSRPPNGESTPRLHRTSRFGPLTTWPGGA
jgi:adenylate cyclase